MSNVTALRGLCPVPFFQESSFPSSGGYIAGRFCADAPSGGADDPRCCLPCPAPDLVYPSNFYSLTRIPGYVNVAGLVLCVFMLLSFLILPLEKTRRQYLNVCLIISIVLLEIGFVVPLFKRPQECYNEITPNDMYSSMTCAFGGAMIVAGGAAINSWILIRALSMHLQIVWDIVPGTVFFYIAQVFGWGLSAILCATCLAFTGVSFRFGDYCHINHHNSLKTFWIPILAFAGVSVLLQLWTFGYCLKVYLKNLYDHQKPNSNNTNNTSSLSHGAQTARAVYRRVMKVLSLQWRGLLIVAVVLVNVIYFATVFILLDSEQAKAMQDVNKMLPWIMCIVENQGDADKCSNIGPGLGVNEATLIATLMLVGIVGIEAWLLIARWEMITGWVHIFRGRSNRDEFVSVDALRNDNGSKAFDTLKLSTQNSMTMTTPDLGPQTPELRHASPVFPGEKIDFFGAVLEREYRSPPSSYSVPVTPLARASTVEREARSPPARSALGRSAQNYHYYNYDQV